jgi:hypothetical protein
MHQSALLSYRCLDQKRRNDNTAARRFKKNLIQLPMCLALPGSCELPSASARLPTFFMMVSSCCSSSEESSEKTLPKSAACFSAQQLLLPIPRLSQLELNPYEGK